MELEVENLLPTAAASSSNGYSNGSSCHSNGRRTRSAARAQARTADEEELEDAQPNSDLDAASGAEEDQDEIDDHVDISPDLRADDLRALKARKQIKDHIIAGHIRQAMDMINAHFPAVLNNNVAGSNNGASGNGNDEGKGATRVKGASGNVCERVLPANPTSMEPDHLLLNLQIQVFIEAIRSANSNQLGVGGQGNGSLGVGGGLPSLASTTPGIAASAISRAASPAPSTSSSNGSATSTTGTNAALNPALHSALSYAQGLYTSAQKLPSYWRAMYLKELEQVTALLAYTDVEHSPVKRFLHKSRKMALAEQVNSAILFRSGKSSQPLIEVAVRQTSFLWNTAVADEVVVGTGHPVWGLVTQGSTGLEEGGGGGGKKGVGAGRKLPQWKFRSFLQER